MDTVNFTTYVQKTSDSKNGMIYLLLILRVGTIVALPCMNESGIGITRCLYVRI